MNIEIIPIALEKMSRRGIKRDMVIQTLEGPDDIVPGHSGRKVAQKLYTIEGNDKLLRVVFEEEKDRTVVVTAYLTSKIEKYRREG